MARLTLTNGKSIVKPFNKVWIVLGVVVALGLVFGYIIKLDSEGISFKPDQLPIILQKLFSPHRGDTWADYFAYIPKLQNVLIMTLEMCYGGTVIGSVLAIPTALLSSRNIVKTKWIYGPARFLLNLFRTIPVTVLAVISIGLVGIAGGSTLAGTIAITLFTYGVMAKMLYELIETIDMNCYEAIESTGASRLQAIRFAVLPQVYASFAGYAIYVFEMNVRSSAILSYVGIASIGTIMRIYEMTDYDKVGGAVILLFGVCVVIQLCSDLARRKLQ